jgi:hypothetical protein
MKWLIIILTVLLIASCTDLGTNNMASKTEKYYTSIVIDLSKVETKESDVKSFVVAVYKGTTNINENITFVRNIIVQAEFIPEKFVYVPGGNVVIKDCEYGVYYYFKIKHDKGSWSEMWSEKAGDNTNGLTFDSNEKYITDYDEFIRVKQKLNNVPNDIDRFEVYIATQTFTNIYDVEPSSTPTAPADNAIPSLTIPFDNVEGSFLIFNINDVNELEWKHIWAKAIDNSGNIGSDGWFYIGYGRKKQNSSEQFVNGDFEDVWYEESSDRYAIRKWKYQNHTTADAYPTAITKIINLVLHIQHTPALMP